MEEEKPLSKEAKITIACIAGGAVIALTGGWAAAAVLGAAGGWALSKKAIKAIKALNEDN